MEKDLKKALRILRSEKRPGIPEAIILLQESGCSIVDTMRVLVEEYGISLGQAKKEVAAHPAWKEVVDATAPLHDNLERDL